MFTTTTIAIVAFILGGVLVNQANRPTELKLQDAEKEIAKLRDELSTKRYELEREKEEYEKSRSSAYALIQEYEEKYGELEPTPED